jgi:hypothetical protein
MAKRRANGGVVWRANTNKARHRRSPSLLRSLIKTLSVIVSALMTAQSKLLMIEGRRNK